ncbi:MAG: TonB family protein [Arenimonas sp.]
MLLRTKLNLDVLSATKTIFVIAFCIALVACSNGQADAPQIAKQDAATIAKAQAARESAEKAKAAMTALSRDELNRLASTAFREQRLYAPAGNNALEYYLVLRKKSDGPDPLVESALMDLAPYTVIAAEQAITRLDFDEAARLRDLIAAIDAAAPSLPRISRDISEGMKNTEALLAAEAKRQQEPLLTAEQAAVKTTLETLKPEIPAIVAKPATSVYTVLNSSPPPAIATSQAPVAPPPSHPIATATLTLTPMPIPAKRSELVAVRTPEPDFPSDALNRGLSGAVEIEFIVQRSGEVSDVRVVNSSQRAFDRQVVMTVKRWKFAPMDESRTVRRSFNFTNPG